jgi:hypothetical protein
VVGDSWRRLREGVARTWVLDPRSLPPEGC